MKFILLLSLFMMSFSSHAAKKDNRTDAGIMNNLLDSTQTIMVMSRLGLSEVQTPSVRDYLTRVRSDFNTIEGTLEDLADRIGIQLESELQDSRKEAREQLDEINDLDAVAFEEAYLKKDIRFHQDLLRRLNEDYIPEATAAALRLTLENLRPRLQAHINNATFLLGHRTGDRFTD